MAATALTIFQMIDAAGIRPLWKNFVHLMKELDAITDNCFEMVCTMTKRVPELDEAKRLLAGVGSDDPVRLLATKYLDGAQDALETVRANRFVRLGVLTAALADVCERMRLPGKEYMDQLIAAGVSKESMWEWEELLGLIKPREEYIDLIDISFKSLIECEFNTKGHVPRHVVRDFYWLDELAPFFGLDSFYDETP